MTDARFEDGAEKPLRLIATDAADLQVVSALIQDAVLPMSEMNWDQKQRRFALLLNRFRWETHFSASGTELPPERVQSVLTVGDVKKISSQGIDRADKELVLSLLDITFSAADDVQGVVELTFSGDGAIRLEVECLELSLQDMTRPYIAPAKRVPSHPE